VSNVLIIAEMPDLVNHMFNDIMHLSSVNKGQTVRIFVDGVTSVWHQCYRAWIDL